MKERGRHRRIDSPAQTEDDPVVADSLADAHASFFDERAHRPVHRTVANVIDEILQDLFASRCVRDFGMKLQPIKLAPRILDGGEIATVRCSDNAKTFRQCRYFVAMTVPNVELVA